MNYRIERLSCNVVKGIMEQWNGGEMNLEDAKTRGVEIFVELGKNVPELK